MPISVLTSKAPDDHSQRGEEGLKPAAFREGDHCGRRQPGNPSTVKGEPP